MILSTASTKPEFGLNYKKGYIGFVFNDKSFISKGIVWFTRWDRENLPPVSHTLVVTGDNECVEANASGIERKDLNQYFDSENYHIFFRKPHGYDAVTASIIVSEAIKHIGHKYDYPLIVSDAVANGFIMHYVNKWTNNMPNRFISWLLDDRNAEICSELVALCMQRVPWLKQLGCLQMPARMITPQMLAKDDQVFVPMKNSI